MEISNGASVASDQCARRGLFVRVVLFPEWAKEFASKPGLSVNQNAACGLSGYGMIQVMGLFDYYDPVPPLRCPVCSTPLREWQGKDGPRKMFVWRQHVSAPISQLAHAHPLLSVKERNAARLPEKFWINSWDCPRHPCLTAECRSINGVWDSTTVVTFNRVFLQTTKDRLRVISNDYSTEEQLFQQGLVGLVDFNGSLSRAKVSQTDATLYSKEKHSVVEQLLLAATPTRSVSIVIPVRGHKKAFLESVHSILRQDFVLRRPELVELVIVEDGSSKDAPCGAELRRLLAKKDFTWKLIRLREHRGRATPRNIGLYFAENTIVLFIDASMVLQQNFVTEHMLRHQRLNNVALLGFKENVTWTTYNKIRTKVAADTVLADYRKDWKWSHRLAPAEAPFTHNHVEYQPKQTINYMDITDNLKSLRGTDQIGLRTLPTFFQTNIASVNRQTVVDLGGFDPRFDAMWGLEDSHLGARLAAWGTKLVPCPSAVAFKIEHAEDPFKGFETVRHRQQFSELAEKEDVSAHSSDLFEKRVQCVMRERLVEDKTVRVRRERL